MQASLHLTLLLCACAGAALDTCAVPQKNTCMPAAAAFNSFSTANTTECCSRCASTAACMAFTHNTKKNTCYLHPMSAAIPTKSGSCTSGVLRAQAPTPPPTPFPTSAKNVIFVISDDMRPEMLAPYHQPHMITPTFDALANESMVFARAYCQQAICGPTRNSFLSGRRPQRTKAWNFKDHFREAGVGEDWVSFPGYFKQHGYTTLGAGKTYHPGLPPDNDGSKSWSQGDGVPGYVAEGDKKGCDTKYFDGSKKSSVCPDSSTKLEDFTDWANLQGILSSLEYASHVRNKTGAPFFLNYGIHRPHLPFHFPAAFGGRNIWEALPPLEDIALPQHARAPAGMPPIAFTYEMDGRKDICAFGSCHPIPGNETGCPFCGGPLPDNATRQMRKGYYAAVSWADYCFGQLLAKVEELGHKDETVIAFVGDHGWQLGEHDIWGKHTNFELGTHVPLIIHGANQTRGIRSSALVESVDIYPTVAALAGLPPPPDVDGTDLTPLWADPAPATPLKEAVFSEYPRCASPSTPWADTTSCIKTDRTDFKIMGYSIRTEAWRAVLWMWWDGKNLVGDFSRDPAAVELYDHSGDDGTDYDKFENVNVADANPDIVAQMLSRAKAHWGKSVSAQG